MQIRIDWSRNCCRGCGRRVPRQRRRACPRKTSAPSNAAGRARSWLWVRRDCGHGGPGIARGGWPSPASPSCFCCRSGSTGTAPPVPSGFFTIGTESSGASRSAPPPTALSVAPSLRIVVTFMRSFGGGESISWSGQQLGATRCRFRGDWAAF